jgi:hypothetical protein
MPASVGLQVLTTSQVLPAAVDWQRVSGRVWQGTVTGFGQGNRRLDVIEWRLEPKRLITGGIGFEVAATGLSGVASASGALRPNLLEITDFEFTMPATAITEHWINWPLVMRGVFNGELSMLKIRLHDQRVLAGEGKVSWREAASGYPQAARLGDLTGRIITSPEDGELLMAIRSDDQFLQLDGEVVIEPTSQYTLTVNAGLGPSAEPALINAMALMGLDPETADAITLGSTGTLAPGGLQFPTLQ